MTDVKPQFLNLPHNRNIAYLTNINPQETSSGILWANGFRSNMTGIKASRLSHWATSRNLSCVRFDYSGNGASSGVFEEATIGDWMEECAAVFDQLTHGPQVLVGSSMGGWIILLVTLAHLKQVGVANSRIKGLVLIAPAVDMTEDLMWQKFPPGIRQGLLQTGVFLRPSAYDDVRYPITLKLIEEGRRHLLFGDEKFNTYCPVRIIHGLRDVDVPWQQSEKLVAHLENKDVRLDLIDDGEHRLSREQDIAHLIAVTEELV